MKNRAFASQIQFSIFLRRKPIERELRMQCSSTPLLLLFVPSLSHLSLFFACEKCNESNLVTWWLHIRSQLDRYKVCDWNCCVNLLICHSYIHTLIHILIRTLIHSLIHSLICIFETVACDLTEWKKLAWKCWKIFVPLGRIIPHISLSVSQLYSYSILPTNQQTGWATNYSMWGKPTKVQICIWICPPTSRESLVNYLQSLCRCLCLCAFYGDFNLCFL